MYIDTLINTKHFIMSWHKYLEEFWPFPMEVATMNSSMIGGSTGFNMYSLSGCQQGEADGIEAKASPPNSIPVFSHLARK
jgi:hypothetical protein